MSGDAAAPVDRYRSLLGRHRHDLPRTTAITGRAGSRSVAGLLLALSPSSSSAPPSTSAALHRASGARLTCRRGCPLREPGARPRRLHAGRLALNPSEAHATALGVLGTEPELRAQASANPGSVSVEVERKIPTMLLRLVGLSTLTVKARDRGALGAMRPWAAIGAAIGGGVLFGAAGIHLEAAGMELMRVSILGATRRARVQRRHRAPHSQPDRGSRVRLLRCALRSKVRMQHLLGSLALVALMLGLSLGRARLVRDGGRQARPTSRPRPRRDCDAGARLGLVLAAAFGALLMLRHGRSASMRSLPLAPFLSSGAAVVVLL